MVTMLPGRHLDLLMHFTSIVWTSLVPSAEFVNVMNLFVMLVTSIYFHQPVSGVATLFFMLNSTTLPAPDSKGT